MLVKCHEHLHPLGRSETNYASQNIFDQDCIFEQTTSTSELLEELVKREFLIFRRCQLDVKDIKCPFQWWKKHEAMFPIVGYLVR
jgi:hypothetical protein